MQRKKFRDKFPRNTWATSLENPSWMSALTISCLEATLKDTHVMKEKEHTTSKDDDDFLSKYSINTSCIMTLRVLK